MTTSHQCEVDISRSESVKIHIAEYLLTFPVNYETQYFPSSCQKQISEQTRTRFIIKYVKIQSADHDAEIQQLYKNKKSYVLKN